MKTCLSFLAVLPMILFTNFGLTPLNAAQQNQIFTLQEAIEAAFEHNHQVRIQKIEKTKAENRVTRGNAGQLPTLSISGDLKWSYSDLELTPGSFFENLITPQQPTNGDDPSGVGIESSSPSSMSSVSYDGVTTTALQAGVGAQYVIFDGFRGRSRYRLLGTGSEIAGLQHKNELEKTILDITRQYIEVATLQEAAALQEMTLEQSQARYEIVKARREYGQVSEQQVLQSLADLKSDSVRYRDLLQRHENAWRNLHLTIGWDQRTVMALETDGASGFQPDHEQLLQALKEYNTSLAIREQRIRYADYEYQLAQSRSIPTVTASAQYGYNYQHASEGQFETQEQLGFTGGLTVSVPIFTGGRNRTERENARESIRQEQLRYDESEQKLRTAFDNTWGQYQHLKSQLATERSNRDVFERNFERAQYSFDRGLITGLELRSAQLTLQSARLRISELVLQVRLLETTLLYLSGELLQA